MEDLQDGTGGDGRPHQAHQHPRPLCEGDRGSQDRHLPERVVRQHRGCGQLQLGLLWGLSAGVREEQQIHDCQTSQTIQAVQAQVQSEKTSRHHREGIRH